jgi:hypothetical protein
LTHFSANTSNSAVSTKDFTIFHLSWIETLPSKPPVSSDVLPINGKGFGPGISLTEVVTLEVWNHTYQPATALVSEATTIETIQDAQPTFGRTESISRMMHAVVADVVARVMFNCELSLLALLIED